MAELVQIVWDMALDFQHLSPKFDHVSRVSSDVLCLLAGRRSVLSGQATMSFQARATRVSWPTARFRCGRLRLPLKMKICFRMFGNFIMLHRVTVHECALSLSSCVIFRNLASLFCSKRFHVCLLVST